MLEEITLTDFQAHRRLHIDFSPGITTIVGPSDAGKSAAIRALRWLAFNAPQGEDFIRWGVKKTTVAITLDGGRAIKRGRGKDGNFYAIDDQKLVSFGTAVPGPVNDILCIGPVNFQQQHDSPFWLAETAGEVSRSLNAIVNLQIIDEVLADLATQKRAAVIAAGVAKDRLAATRAARRGLSHVPDFVADTKTIEKAVAGLDARRDKIRRLAKMLDAAQQAGKRAAQRQIEAEAAERLRQAGERAARAGKKYKTLAGLIARAGAAKKTASRTPPDVRPLDEAKRRYTAAHDRAAHFRKRLVAALAAEADVRDAAKAAARAARDLDTATKKMGVCPICQRPM